MPCRRAALSLAVVLAMPLAATPSLATVNEVTTYATVTGAGLFGLAFDASGNLYTCGQHASGSGVWKVGPGGSPVTSFVTGMVNPKGIAIDASGNLFVSDWGDGASIAAKIWKVTPAGVKSVFASPASPAGIVIDNSGNLLVSQWGVHNVVKVTPAGVVSNYATGISGATEEVGGLAYDTSTGDLYVACETSIKRIGPGGSPVTTAVSGLVGCQYGLARDFDGTLYLGRFSHRDVYTATIGGAGSLYAGAHLDSGCNNGPLLAARFALPAFMVVRNGTLYIADFDCHMVRSIDLPGAAAVPAAKSPLVMLVLALTGAAALLARGLRGRKERTAV